MVLNDHSFCVSVHITVTRKTFPIDVVVDDHLSSQFGLPKSTVKVTNTKIIKRKKREKVPIIKIM